MVTENIAVISKSVPSVLSGSYVKTVLRHIWKNYGELTDDARYAPKFRELYARRKATIKKNMACACFLWKPIAKSGLFCSK